VPFQEALYVWRESLGNLDYDVCSEAIQREFVGGLHALFSDSALELLRRMDTVRSLLAVQTPAEAGGSERGPPAPQPLAAVAAPAAEAGVSGLRAAARFLFSAVAAEGDDGARDGGSGGRSGEGGVSDGAPRRGPHPYLHRHRRSVLLAVQGRRRSHAQSGPRQHAAGSGSGGPRPPPHAHTPRRNGARGAGGGDFDGADAQEDGAADPLAQAWESVEAVAFDAAGGGDDGGDEESSATQPHIEALSTLLGDAATLLMAVHEAGVAAAVPGPAREGVLRALHGLCGQAALRMLLAYRGDTMLDCTLRVATAVLHEALETDAPMLRAVCSAAGIPAHLVLAEGRSREGGGGMGGGGGGGGGGFGSGGRGAEDAATAPTLDQRAVCVPLPLPQRYTPTAEEFAAAAAQAARAAADAAVAGWSSGGLAPPHAATPGPGHPRSGSRAPGGAAPGSADSATSTGAAPCCVPVEVAVSIVDETADQVSFLCQLLERYTRCAAFCIAACQQQPEQPAAALQSSRVGDSRGASSAGGAGAGVVASPATGATGPAAPQPHHRPASSSSGSSLSLAGSPADVLGGRDPLCLAMWELQGQYVQLERSYLLTSVRLALLPPAGWAVVSVHEDARVRAYAWCDNVFFLLSKAVSRSAATCADMAAAAVTNYVAGCCDDVLRRALHVCLAGCRLVRSRGDPRLRPSVLRHLLMDAVTAAAKGSGGASGGAASGFLSALLASGDADEDVGAVAVLRPGGGGAGSGGSGDGGDPEASDRGSGGGGGSDDIDADVAAVFQAALRSAGSDGSGGDGAQSAPALVAGDSVFDGGAGAGGSAGGGSRPSLLALSAGQPPVASDTALLCANTVATAVQYAAALFDRTSRELAAVFPGAPQPAGAAAAGGSGGGGGARSGKGSGASAGGGAGAAASAQPALLHCSPLLVAPLMQLREASQACAALLPGAARNLSAAVCAAGLRVFRGVLSSTSYIVPSSAAYDTLSAHDPLLAAAQGPVLAGSAFFATLPLLLKPAVSDAFVLELAGLLARQLEGAWSTCAVNEYGALLMVGQLRSLYGLLAPHVRAAHGPLRGLLASGRVHQMVQVLNVEALSDLYGLVFPVPQLSRDDVCALLLNRVGFLHHAPPAGAAGAAPGANASDGRDASDGARASRAATAVLETVQWHRVPTAGP
jgi:hypothetical protein